MLRVTIEKQKGWKRETMEEKVNWGVDGFTITDLPFSTFTQAYWFLAAGIANTVLFPFKFWHNTDSYYFYHNTFNNKKWYEFFTIFLKLQKRLLDHEDTFTAIEQTPKAIVSVAVNTHTLKTSKKRVSKILRSEVGKNLKGIFIVSGGGIFQRYLNKYFKIWPTSKDLIPYIREKFPNIKIFAAANTNLQSENVERLIAKNPDEVLTQPPFIFSNFEKYIKEIGKNNSLKNIQVRVGIPIFTSAWNVRFWMTLVGVNWKKEREARELVEIFDREWASDKSKEKTKFKKFSITWSANLIKKVDGLSEKIVGIHMMPMGNSIGVEEVLIEAGILPNPLLGIPGAIYENIKYKNHFRDKVTYRTFENSGNMEMIIDLNQFDYKNYTKLVTEARNINDSRKEEKIELEKDFQTQAKSILWDFNYEFWQHLPKFMHALGKDYKKSIGGSADSNHNLIGYCAKKLSSSFVDSEMNYYLEIGAAGTGWAKEILSHMQTENKANNLTYIFTDFSQEVLEIAKKELGENYLGARIEYHLINNKENNEKFLETYKNKISKIHATNLYDNFKANRFLFKNGKMYQILTKLVISKNNFEKLEKSDPKLLEKITELKNTKNVSVFIEKISYKLWEDLWNAAKFEEKCVEVESLPGKVNYIDFERLEFISSNSVTRDIVNNFNLLKTGGTIEIIDIIAENISDFKNYLGPVKYDASVANYINFPEIEQALNKNYPNHTSIIKSLHEFGGKNNQSILEIYKN